MKGYIYMYTSPSLKSYIGQTRYTPEKRAGKHGTGYRGMTPFYSAIKKYGFNNFSLVILREIEKDTIQDLVDSMNIAEKQEILSKNTIYPNGYNLYDGGLNRVMNDYSKEKLRISNIGRKHSQETKDKISRHFKGIKTRPRTDWVWKG